jgi:8-oxo-dGTP pyrophosphatase MutT (NUDIX family)
MPNTKILVGISTVVTLTTDMMATYRAPVNRPDAADPRLAAVRGWLAARAAAGPVDGREAASLRRFASELDRLVAPFDRNADPVHITASAIVVGPQGVLLHRHKRLGLWLQPGGHIDPGEAPLEAARRETFEETGLVGVPRLPDVAHVDVHGGGLGHVHLDLRFVLQASGPPRPGESESQAVRWLGWAEALAIADPGLRGALVSMAR